MAPSTPSLRVHLFGQPRFEFGGAPFKFASLPKALPLLVYLVLHRSAPLPREKIAFTLWEDDTEDDARANLRRHLYHLQRALPPTGPDESPWIVHEGDSVQWNTPAAWVDVVEFERLAAIPARHRDAVELYGGDLFDSSYEEWLFAERDRLRTLYLSLLGDLVVSSRAERDLARAGVYAQRILTNDPWREDTVRQLMSIRYEAGDRAGAIALYRDFERRLRDEMNVEPMTETIALRDLVMHNQPLPATASHNGHAARLASETPGTALLPFVGREREIEQLRMSWSRAARGRGGVVLLGGEAGIGKTRLATEFALFAEAQGARLIAGTTAYPESRPFQAIAEALRGAASLLVALDIPPIWLGVAAQAVPELRARAPALPLAPAVDPDHERNRLFEAFAACVEALASPRPLVIVLEDMHWAGEASIAALEFLARRIANKPVFVIATYRDEESGRAHPLRRMRRELQEERLLTTLTPRHLQRDAVVELMERTPALTGSAPELADLLMERSAGNPLFLNEVIRGVTETGGGDRIAGSALPSSARHAIAQRVQRLPEAARALAEVASIIGRGFDIELVREVTGWDENAVLDGVSDLLDRSIIKESGGRSGFAYVFSHHLVQSTIYEDAPEQARMRRHRRIARALKQIYADRAGEFAADVARHHDEGREPERAAEAYVDAARHANELFAYEDALRWLERSLTLTTDAGLRRTALLMRESIRSRRGDRAGQREDLNVLEQLAADAPDDPAFACEVLRRKAALARTLAEREQERELVDRFRARADAWGDAHARADALVTAAAYVHSTGDHAQAKELARAALALFEQLGDADGVVEARCRLAEIQTEGGGFAAALAMVDEVRAMSVGAMRSVRLARALTSATHAAIVEQRYAKCVELSEEARGLYRQIGDREGEADVLSRQASATVRLGRLDEARKLYDEAAALYAAIGKRLGLAAVLANGGVLSVQLGMLDEAETALAGAREQFRVLGDVRGQAACAINQSFIALLRGHAESARSLADEALGWARTMHYANYEAAALANTGQAERDLGHIEAAIEHMREGIAIRRKVSEQGDFGDDLANLASAYLLAGDRASAAALADELFAALESATAMVFLPQIAYWTAAQVFRALGDRKRAAAMLARAQEAVARQSAAIGGASERKSFEALPVNHEIEAAAKRKVWPALDARVLARKST